MLSGMEQGAQSWPRRYRLFLIIILATFQSAIPLLSTFQLTLSSEHSMTPKMSFVILGLYYYVSHISIFSILAIKCCTIDSKLTTMFTN